MHSLHLWLFTSSNPLYVGPTVYRSGPNGLPTALGTHCVGQALPAHLRQYGDNTVLHQCIEESLDVNQFRKFLDHPQRPHLDVR